tara:strand:+ start:80 stop:1216 length:1137 start_codon:yes stop_codon:yes gene_type:complete
MEIAWQFLKAWPEDPSDEPMSHLPLQHPARKRHRGQAARTGGIEGLEGTMPPEFSSDIAEQEEYTEGFYDNEERRGKYRSRMEREQERADKMESEYEEAKEAKAWLESIDYDRERTGHYPEYDKEEMQRASDLAAGFERAARSASTARERAEMAEGEYYSFEDDGSFDYTPGGYGSLPSKRERTPYMEPVSREEALAGEGAEMPDPHESEPPEGEPPERGLESAWREITGSGGTVAEELEEHLRPAEEKEQQVREEKSQLNEMARQMGEEAENYFTEGAERSEPNTYANMTTDELRDVYRPLAQQHSSMSDEEQEADPDFMEELEKVRQALRSAEWKEGQNEPPTTESTTARPTRGGRRGNVRVQPRRGTPRRYTRGE